MQNRSRQLICPGTAMPILLCNLVIMISMLSGCGTAMHWNGKGKRGPELVFSRPKAKTDDKKTKDKAEENSKETELTAKSETDKPAESKEKAKTEQVTASQAKPAVQHNQETLKLIEQEFAHLPQAERDQLYQDLKKLDPAMVKLILKTTLNAKRTGQSKTQFAQQTTESDEPGLAAMPKPQPAAHPNPIPNSYQMNATQGLGSAQPWQQNQIQSNAPSQLIQTNYAPNGTPAALITQPAINAPVALQGHIQQLPGQSPFAANPQTNNFAQPAANTRQNNAFQQNALQNQQQYMSQAMNLMAQNPLMQNSGLTGGASAQSFGQLMQLSAQNAQRPMQNLSGTLPPAAHNAAISSPGQQQPIGGYSPQQIPQQYGHQPQSYANNIANTPTTQQFIQHVGGLNANQLATMIATLETNLAQLPVAQTEAQRLQHIEQHVNLRMMYLIAGQKERAIQAIPGIPPADQEFWQQVFWSMTNYFDHVAMADGMDRAAQTIAQLRTAVQRLSETARLELRNVTFCHKIDSFGNYMRFPKDEFRPGQPVLLYAEVDNYKSEATANGQYRTVLKSTIEIYRAGPNGGLIKRESFPATEDLCNNRRNDYFHSYEFTIPQQITLGPHVLKLTVEDQLSQKLATYTLNFVVK